jgi:Protein of unknown function (DUF998)
MIHPRRSSIWLAILRHVPTSRQSSAILAGIAAPIVSWGLSLVVIVGWPGYDPLRQSISLLANAPLGWLQTLAFAISGLLGLAWAFGLSSVLGATRRDRAIVLGLLLLQALIAFGFAILPTDPEGVPTTTIGALHLADFYLYSVTMPLTLLGLALVMRPDRRWRGSARPTLIAGGVALASIALVPATLDGPLTPWLGLLERLYVAIPSIWQLGAGIVAWRLVRAGPAAAPTAPRNDRDPLKGSRPGEVMP